MFLKLINSLSTQEIYCHQIAPINLLRNNEKIKFHALEHSFVSFSLFLSHSLLLYVSKFSLVERGSKLESVYVIEIQ